MSVSPGDKINGRLSAAKWNALDALLKPPTSTTVGGTSDSARDGIVLVRNKTGYPRTTGDVVGLSEPVLKNSVAQMALGLEFDGVMPTDGTDDSTDYTGQFAIYITPCGENDLAPALLIGLTAAKLSMQAADDQFADVYHNTPTKLKSSGTGAAQILWAQPSSSYPADVVGVVRLGNRGTPSTYILKTPATTEDDPDGIPAADWTSNELTPGSRTLNVWKFNSESKLEETDQELEVFNLSTTAVEPDKFIISAKEGKSGKWIVIYEDCEALPEA
jgi:hypothetical protein